MSIKKNAMGTGVPAAAASALVGGVNNGVTTPLGSTQAGAVLLPSVTSHVLTAGAGSTGVILPPGNGTTDSLVAGDWMAVANYSGQTIIVYPPLGGKLNNGTLNAGLSLTDKKVAQFFCIDGTNFFYNLTA